MICPIDNIEMPKKVSDGIANSADQGSSLIRKIMICVGAYASGKQVRVTNVHPLTPHFVIVKLGFTGVYIFFLFLLQNIDCGYSLVPTINGLSKNKKNINKFHLKMNIFTAVKYCCILHGRVCVMSILLM